MLNREQKYLLKIVLILVLFFTPLSISAKRVVQKEPFFKTENKSIAVYSIKNRDKITPKKVCNTCDSSMLSDIIKNEITLLNKSLISEFRRCAKFGIYTVVDTTLPHSLSVKLIFSEARIISDTLLIPFSVTTTETNTKRKIIKDYRHFVIIPKYEKATDRSDFYSISRAIAEYRKTFPIKKIVSNFYPEKNLSIQ